MPRYPIPTTLRDNAVMETVRIKLNLNAISDQRTQKIKIQNYVNWAICFRRFYRWQNTHHVRSFVRNELIKMTDKTQNFRNRKKNVLEIHGATGSIGIGLMAREEWTDWKSKRNECDRFGCYVCQ